MAFNRDKRAEQQQDELDEHTVFINRCAKTVKGGRRMSFSAVIVVGDKDASSPSLRLFFRFSVISKRKVCQVNLLRLAFNGLCVISKIKYLRHF